MSTVTVESSRFGTLEIEAGAIIEFPAGLIGLGGRRWAVVTQGPRRPVLVAALARRPGAGAARDQPVGFFSDYEVELSDADGDRVAATTTWPSGSPSAPAPSSPTSARTSARRSSSRRGQGFQVINEAAHAPVRAPLFPDAQAEAAAA